MESVNVYKWIWLFYTTAVQFCANEKHMSTDINEEFPVDYSRKGRCIIVGLKANEKVARLQ